MAILFKVIKPKRLDEAAMRKQLRNGLERMGPRLLRDFQATTATWEHKVVFERHTRVRMREDAVWLEVTTHDPIYGYVDKGTKPHMIFAGIYTGKSNKRALAFHPGSSPKTTPNVLSSGPGSVGGPLIMRPYVHHPGTKPRNFTKMIEVKWRPKFLAEMHKSMKAAAKASGNGISR